ncbi:MAG: Uma2 family endonuclease [Flaviaesturariibacter sp.]|nr:Uma2 family endonuclease [Flaviaesturariibacter sp.]
MNSRSIPADWLPQYNYADYAKWEGNWELIYGFPYAMSPSPKRAHQVAERKFMRLVEDALESEKLNCDCAVFHELDWIINDTTVVRPDVMIVCGDFKDDFLHFPPVLIVEITSESTRMNDRNVKFKLYESQGVKYYIMVDPERTLIEVFNLKDNLYQEFNSIRFQLTSSCSVELNLEKICK